MLDLPANQKFFFASDLHLSQDTPKTLEAFERWLISISSAESQIFLLGDIFEVWLGEDYSDEVVTKVRLALSRSSDSGTKIHFMQGNRDFLLGHEFCESTGMDFLPDPEFINCNGMPILITHGDQLCTDDKAYQKFRQMSRSEKWQTSFLAKSLEERIRFAKIAREESSKHKSSASEGIMDVNLAATDNVFRGRWPDGDYVGSSTAVIHGHTHRCAVHGPEQPGLLSETFSGQISQDTRIVLPDWDFDSAGRNGYKGGFLGLDHSGFFELTLLR